MSTLLIWIGKYPVRGCLFEFFSEEVTAKPKITKCLLRETFKEIIIILFT